MIMEDKIKSYKLDFLIGGTGGGNKRSQNRQKYIKKITSSIGNVDDTITCNVFVDVQFMFPGSTNRDVDNMLKILFDGLKLSRAIKDDVQIKKVLAEILENSKEPCILIDIYEYQPKI